jgi:hypothetical protein
LAFAHSSNINLMPRPHVSTVLREYITLAIVGFRGPLLLPSCLKRVIQRHCLSCQRQRQQCRRPCLGMRTASRKHQLAALSFPSLTATRPRQTRLGLGVLQGS